MRRGPRPFVFDIPFWRSARTTFVTVIAAMALLSGCGGSAGDPIFRRVATYPRTDRMRDHHLVRICPASYACWSFGLTAGQLDTSLQVCLRPGAGILAQATRFSIADIQRPQSPEAPFARRDWNGTLSCTATQVSSRADRRTAVTTDDNKLCPSLLLSTVIICGFNFFSDKDQLVNRWPAERRSRLAQCGDYLWIAER